MSSDLTRADLAAVPLFPLPGIVLFPRAVLPLHIFEDRYRAMTADALAGDRLIAMALLKPGWEKNYYGRPALEPVVCVGRILSHEQLPDGKYNFLLQGELAARVISESRDRAYRTAHLEPLAMTPVMEIDLSPQRERLTELFLSSPLGRISAGPQFCQLLKGPLPTVDVANLAAFTFLDDVPLKQSLLEESDTMMRIDRTTNALEALAERLRLRGIGGASDEIDPRMN